jgi:hypothetical protein
MTQSPNTSSPRRFPAHLTLVEVSRVDPKDPKTQVIKRLETAATQNEDLQYKLTRLKFEMSNVKS